jgi:hypothetical protein
MELSDTLTNRMQNMEHAINVNTKNGSVFKLPKTLLQQRWAVRKLNKVIVEKFNIRITIIYRSQI